MYERFKEGFRSVKFFAALRHQDTKPEMPKSFKDRYLNGPCLEICCLFCFVVCLYQPLPCKGNNICVCLMSGLTYISKELIPYSGPNLNAQQGLRNYFNAAQMVFMF